MPVETEAGGEEQSLEDIAQQAQQFNQQLDAMWAWALQQAADLRAKAELAEEMDCDPDDYDSMPGEAEEMRDVAELLDTIAMRITSGGQ